MIRLGVVALAHSVRPLRTLVLAGVCVSASVARAQSPTAILDRVRVDGRRPIDFHAITLPETVYVGQQTTYQVAVLLNADARSRLRRNPEFLPPELRGLLAYELGTPSRVPPRTFAGGVYEAHVFQRALFPVASGLQFIPAPQLTYSLPQSSSYFSREERSVVKAESASVFVKLLPIAGRPVDFNGAVGVFTTSVRLDTTTVRVGDPLVLTLRVQGTGNVKLLPRPSLELEWASAVPGTERIQVDSAGPLVRGVKEFDWILTPARDGRVSVPSITYSYFDPYSSRYAVAASAPLSLEVRAGSLAVADESDAGALLPLRERTVGEAAPNVWIGNGQFPSSWWLWVLLLLLAPLPAWWWSRTPRAKGMSKTGAAYVGRDPASEASASRASPEREAARSTRRTFLEALAMRFGQTPQDLVSRRFVARLLRRSGVTRATTRDAIALLDVLDELGFAAEPPTSDAPRQAAAAEQAATQLLRRVEAEAIPRGKRVAGTSLGSAMLMLVGLSLVVAAPIARAQRPADSSTGSAESAGGDLRALAQRAYEHRAFVDAAKRFAELAKQSPLDPDVLTNWGTAAWAAGDTVNAVIAWQRAARMQPLAADLQERVSLLPAGARGGVANVAMIPVPWLVDAAIAGWCIAWLLVAFRARRLRGVPAFARTGASTWIRNVAMTLIVVACAAGGAAIWGVRALDATDLAVVSRPETMRVAPGVDADAMGGVTTGDVVRVVEYRESWQRVQHADGRRGWLPAVRLVALQAGPTPH